MGPLLYRHIVNIRGRKVERFFIYCCAFRIMLPVIFLQETHIARRPFGYVYPCPLFEPHGRNTSVFDLVPLPFSKKIRLFSVFSTNGFLPFENDRHIFVWVTKLLSNYGISYYKFHLPFTKRMYGSRFLTCINFTMCKNVVCENISNLSHSYTYSIQIGF